MNDPPYRTGTVAVIGRPNVGKSTLVNALVGARVSIVTPRAQTTRHRVLGIAHAPGGQVLLVDTPGLHLRQPRAINRYLNRAARGALEGVEAAMLVIEAGRWTDEDELAWSLCERSGVPCVLVINKVDRLKDKAKLLPFIGEVTNERRFVAVHPVSALKGIGLEALLAGLLALLPEAGPLYAEDEITDRSSRFIAAELVREQLMLRLGDELPYSTAVEIEGFSEDDGLLRIGAIIWVERDGQKPIVIGRGGERLKAIGRGARERMEALFGTKVFLQTWCKVRAGWSDDENALHRFGYGD